MQTFLPYDDFDKSAKCLDYKRLLNQRNEAYIICAHIFPAHIEFQCKQCWDKGEIPFCSSCKKAYRACNCSVCKDKGKIPRCPNCQRSPGPTKEMIGWASHPAVRMWKPYRWALLCYTFTICRECQHRGFQDTVIDKLLRYGKELNFVSLNSGLLPKWFGDLSFHASHRSNLLRKDPKWYGKFGWTEPDNLPYVWPK